MRLRSGFPLKFHSARRQACILHNRKRIYLGKWPNHPEKPPSSVLRKYEAVVSKLLLDQHGVEADFIPGEKTLGELVDLWLTWADKRYRNKQTANDLHGSLKPLLHLYASEPASKVGPRRIAEAQQLMSKQGRTRQGINKATRNIRQCFAWGVAQELLRPEHLVAIRAMQPLRKGAIEAPESKRRSAVSLEVVRLTLPHLSPTVADMVQLQLITGMRPFEVCSISAAEIDMTGDIWVFRPAEHKMAHLGRERCIPLVQEAMHILRKYMRPDGLPLFSPAEERLRWEKEKRELRKTPVQPSQLSRRKEKPQRCAGNQYTTNSYRRAIERACSRCRQWQKSQGLQPNHPNWSPNALRKSAAQRVADTLGLDAARALLGHADSTITKRHYALHDLEVAIKAAKNLSEILPEIR